MYTDIELCCAPQTNITPIISRFLKTQTWPYTHKVYMQAQEDTSTNEGIHMREKKMKHR